MSLSAKDHRMFDSHLGKIDHNVNMLSYDLALCLTMEKLLWKSIRHGKAKWHYVGDSISVDLEEGYRVTLVLRKTETVVNIEQRRTWGTMRLIQLPPLHVSSNIWFGAYDRALKDMQMVTLREVFEADYMENENKVSRC